VSPSSSDSVPLTSSRTSDAEHELSRHMRSSSITDRDLAQNAALFMPPRSLKRLMFLDELYRAALSVHGIIVQFGTLWGRDIGVFDGLRTIYEPFNISRRVVCFDSFAGFPSVHEKDGTDPVIAPGEFSTTRGYETELEDIMRLRQELDPLPELQRYEVIKGDAVTQLRAYLERHPETIVSLVYFDLDIYEPTKGALEALKPFVTKGTVLAFDELNFFKAPGETLALKEVYPLDTIRVRRSTQYSGTPSYFVIE
jgi:hypothetical protein